MHRFGHGFQEELMADVNGELSLIDHACLIWRVLNSVSLYYAQTYSAWHVMRYEDLANNPVSEFRELYRQLGLPWTADVREKIARHNLATNPADVDTAQRTNTRRNSTAAIWTWLNRLDEAEINHIYRATRDIASFWYSDLDWPATVDARK